MARAWYRFAAFGQPGALESGANWAPQTESTAPVMKFQAPWVPFSLLGSPWARKKIQIGHGFFDIFCWVSVKIRDLASEVTDHAMIWALEDEFPPRVNANMIQAGKMLTNLDVRSEHMEFIFDLTTTYGDLMGFV